MCAGGLALVIPLLTINAVDAPGWLPRYSLFPVEAAIGLPLLVGAVRSTSRRPAIACALFCAVAAISTALSHNPTMSFWGGYLWGNGLLFVLAMAGMWAIGNTAGSSGARAVERALLIGLAVNVVVALIQVFADLTRFGVQKIFDQPTGLLGQPVQLGEFLLGGLWLVAVRAARGDRRFLLALVPVAAAIECTAERVPLVLSVAVATLAAWRVPSRLRVLVPAVVVVGLVVGFGLTQVSSQSDSASSRLAGGATTAGRVDNYREALDAIKDRPLLGAGPGRYLSAVSPYRSERLAKALPDSYYADAHDWPLQWAVTTGLLGLAALLVWLYLAARTATGPLAGFAAAVAVVGLVQPHDAGVTLLALLALGAAGTSSSTRQPVPTVARAVLVMGACVVTGSILIGGWHGYLGVLRNPAEANLAADYLPPFPERAFFAARAAFVDLRLTPDQRADAQRRLAREAVARDDQEPNILFQAGSTLLSLGDIDEARALFERELALDPYSAQAMVGLGAIDQLHGDLASARDWYERSLDIDPSNQVARQRLDEVRTALSGS